MSTTSDQSIDPGPDRIHFHIQDFLSGSISSAPGETAGLIDGEFLAHRDLEDAFGSLWDSVFTVVTMHPEQHDRLLSLLQALRALSTAKPDRGVKIFGQETEARDDDGGIDWVGLPFFGMRWRNRRDRLGGWRTESLDRDMERLGADTDELSTQDKYFNLNLFSGKLVAHDPGFDSIEAIWGFFACRDALEWRGPQAWERSGTKTSRTRSLRADQVWSLDVRVAALWIRIAGKQVLDFAVPEYWCRGVRSETDYWKRGDSEPLSKHRWELWMGRFDRLGREMLLDGVARSESRLAGECLTGLLAERAHRLID